MMLLVMVSLFFYGPEFPLNYESSHHDNPVYNYSIAWALEREKSFSRHFTLKVEGTSVLQ
jgi:hypothetical protein